MLTPDDAAAVLRRAAELDTPALEQADALDEQVVRDAAREVGLSESAVEQAVAEWRAGVLEPLPPLPADRRVGLLATVAVEARLAVPPERAEGLVAAWLASQWFERRRTRGRESEWAPRAGLVARARRAADLGHRLRLKHVDRLRVGIAPAADGSRVRLVADLGDTRRGLLAAMVAVPAVVGGVATGAVVDGLPEVLFALPTAAGAGGLGWLGAHRVLDTRRRAVADELEAGLDRLLDAPSAKKALPERATSWALERIQSARPRR